MNPVFIGGTSVWNKPFLFLKQKKYKTEFLLPTLTRFVGGDLHGVDAQVPGTHQGPPCLLYSWATYRSESGGPNSRPLCATLEAVELS